MEAPKPLLKRNYLRISKDVDNEDETLQVASKQAKLSFNHDETSENNMLDDVEEEHVVILLDCRVSSSMLQVKMECTSFLMCKCVELNEIFNRFGYDIIKDTIIQQFVVRITGKYTPSKKVILDYKNKSIPFPNSVMNVIGNNVEIMKNLTEAFYLNNRIIDQCGYLIQNNINFVYSIIRNIYPRQALSLPLMESETAVKLLEKNSNLFGYLPLRFRKDKQVAIATIRNNGELELIDKELLLDKDISYEFAKKGLQKFVHVSHERNYLIAKLNSSYFIEGDDFEILKHKYNSDKEISILTAKQKIDFYHYLSDELKHDADILLGLIGKDQFITKFGYSLHIKDKEFILKAVEINPFILKYASEELRGDTDVILKTFSHSHCFSKNLYQFVSKELWKNKDFVMEAIKYSSNIYSCISSTELKHDRDVIIKTLENGAIPYLENYLSDKEVMKKAIINRPIILRILQNNSCKLLNNRDFILDLVNDSGFILEFVSDEFKNDKEIVMKAILSELESFKYASDELKNDREFNLKLCCKKAKRIFNDVFRYISDVFKNDYDFLFNVFNQVKHPLNIEHLSYKVRNDKNLMLSALKLDSQYIEFISDELKKDLSFIKEYITINSDCNLCRSWKLDKMIMIEILKINPKLYHQIYENSLRKDDDILAEALKFTDNLCLVKKLDNNIDISNILNKEMVLNGLRCNDNRFYLHASDEIKNDREVIIQYLKSGGKVEKIRVQIWNDDFEIMNLVIEMDACLIFEMGSKFIENEDFVLKAFTFNPKSIRKAIENGYKFSNSLVNRIFEYFKCKSFNEVKELILLIDDKQVVLEQVRKYPNLVEYCQFRNDKEIILEACKRDYNTFYFAYETLESDKEFILECSKYGPVMKYVTSTTLNSDFEFMKMASKINMMNVLYYKGTHDVKLEIFKECWCEFVRNSLSPNKFIKYGKYLCEHTIQF